MAGNKAIYAIAVAIFAGLALIGVTNITTQNTVPLNINSDSQAFAQTIGIRQNIISVTGTATKNVAPDQVIVNFGLETRALTAEEASQQNAKTMTSMIDAVKAMGITEKELSTSNFNIFPVYDEKGSVITGYKVSNTVSVKTKMLDKAGQIIDTAVKAGANRVDSVYFTLSDDLQKQLRDDLIPDAVKDAQMKADKALEPVGKKITGVKSISLSEFGVPPPVTLERVPAVAGLEAPPPPIFKSEQQVSMSVSVIFLID